MSSIIKLFKSCVGCVDVEPELCMSRTERMMIIRMYDIDYTIYDRATGEVLDLDVEDIDDTSHTIRIMDEPFFRSKMFNNE